MLILQGRTSSHFYIYRTVTIWWIFKISRNVVKTLGMYFNFAFKSIHYSVLRQHYSTVKNWSFCAWLTVIVFHNEYLSLLHTRLHTAYTTSCIITWFWMLLSMEQLLRQLPVLYIWVTVLMILKTVKATYGGLNIFSCSALLHKISVILI